MSKNAIIESMGQPSVLNSLPFNILKSLPREKLGILSPDIFFVVQMLVGLEIPGSKLQALPSPLLTENLGQKVKLHRETYLQDSDAHQGFTTDDVTAALKAFAASHSACARWLRIILGLNKNAPVEEKLAEVTDTFFEKVTGMSAGYTPECVAVAVLVYHLDPKMNVRQGTMMLSPAVRLCANSRGEAKKTYCPAEACGNEVVLAANRFPAYWRCLEGKRPECEDDLAVLNSLPVASPPVMCWICGEGFLSNNALKLHCEKKSWRSS